MRCEGESVRGIWDHIQQRVSLDDLIVRAGGILLTVILAWFAYWIIRRAALGGLRATGDRVQDPAHRQRMTTLVLLTLSITKYAIIFVAAVMIIQRQLNLNPYPVLLSAGVVGLAVGFGAQNLVRDMVSGFFIIMEGQYAVGDLVEINGALGRVEEVGLRVTRIRDPNGQIRFFPNGSITAANNYVQRYIPYVVTTPFARDAAGDLCALVRGILEDFGREFAVFLDPPEVGDIQELATYGRVVRAEVHVIPGRQAIVEQKLPSRVAGALERAGRALPQGADVGLALRPLDPPSH
jgi:small conductance mechanosensitive channel